MDTKMMEKDSFLEKKKCKIIKQIASHKTKAFF